MLKALPLQLGCCRNLPGALLLRLALCLPFHLVQEVEVTLVEVVDADVPILPTTRIPTALGINGDRIERPEMAFDAPDLVFEDLVVESCLKFTLTGRSCGDVHGCLATPKDDEVLLWRNGGSVERCVGGIGFHKR